MKNAKKLFHLLLVAVMILAMGVHAAAAMDGHTFTAYEIFDGTQAENSNELGQIEWAKTIDADAFLAALKADNMIGASFAACETADDVAKVLSSFSNYSAEAMQFAAIAHNNVTGEGIEVVAHKTVLEAGYYLIVDTTEVEDGAHDFVYNLSLLHLSTKGSFGIESKVAVPDIEKKVKDFNDSTDAGMSDWQDSADYDIGDMVPFQLTATMPSTLDGYKTYTMIFHDELSAGLTYDMAKADMMVSIVPKEGNAIDLTSGYSVAYANGELTIAFDDVLKLGATTESKIVVTYYAQLNENAVIGAAGNPNTVYLEYSNNPNASGDGKDDSTTTSKEDTVIVFTYSLHIDKVDSNAQDLIGATFALFKNVAGEWVQIGKNVEGSALSDGHVANEYQWDGIDDGVYKLVEVVVPDGYNKMEDLIFTVTAEHTEHSDTPALERLECSMTRDINAGTGMIKSDIVNEKGTLLPATGGVGTTLFVTVGCMLFMATGVVLVTKKRLYNEG